MTTRSRGGGGVERHENPCGWMRTANAPCGGVAADVRICRCGHRRRRSRRAGHHHAGEVQSNGVGRGDRRGTSGSRPRGEGEVSRRGEVEMSDQVGESHQGPAGAAGNSCGPRRHGSRRGRRALSDIVALSLGGRGRLLERDPGGRGERSGRRRVEIGVGEDVPPSVHRGLNGPSRRATSAAAASGLTMEGRRVRAVRASIAPARRAATPVNGPSPRMSGRRPARSAARILAGLTNDSDEGRQAAATSSSRSARAGSWAAGRRARAYASRANTGRGDQ